MNSFVLDCSVAMRWCFEDEAKSDTDAVYDAMRFKGFRVLVPCVFFPEVTNTLLIGERRKRCSALKAEEFLKNLLAMPIYVDDYDVGTLAQQVHQLSRRFALTAYDGFYLDLAMRHGVALATRDKALRAAAEPAGVQLFEGA